MSKPVFEKASEDWTVRNFDKSGEVKTDYKVVLKTVVRVRKGLPGAGQFHGATNFRER